MFELRVYCLRIDFVLRFALIRYCFCIYVRALLFVLCLNCLWIAFVLLFNCVIYCLCIAFVMMCCIDVLFLWYNGCIDLCCGFVLRLY